MSRNTISRNRLLKDLCVSAVAAPVLFFTVLILRRPEQFSTQFLKTGGRMVKKAIDNLGRVGVGLAVAVVLLWGIIMLACWFQSNNQQSAPPN